MEKDEERHAAKASDKGVSVERSQGTPAAAPSAITAMVNYTGVTDIETEGGKDALSAIYAALAKISGRHPKMHKAFTRHEVLVSQRGKGL